MELISGFLLKLLDILFPRYFDGQKQTREHDINIYRKSDEILSEEKLLNITNFDLPDSIYVDNYQTLINWCDFFNKTGNQYLNEDIKKHNKKLHDSLLGVNKFIRLNFYEIRGQNANNKPIYLRPEWNSDYENNVTKEEDAKWNEYAKELNTLIDRVLSHYSEYREVVKKRLKI